MKYLAPLCLVFAILTNPQGKEIWIAKYQVVAVEYPIDCAKDAHAKIITLGGNFCVAEDPPDVARKIETP